MKIQLHFGFCHTIVLDKDSKFFGVFKEAVDLLQIDCHVLSGENHNGMLVECITQQRFEDYDQRTQLCPSRY